ncbi:UNVERIFIED_CONTAM: hypothetical protein FKN15_003060 [Acipenser sinensis]
MNRASLLNYYSTWLTTATPELTRERDEDEHSCPPKRVPSAFFALQAHRAAISRTYIAVGPRSSELCTASLQAPGQPQGLLVYEGEALLSPVPEGEALLSPVPEGEALISSVPEGEALLSSVPEGEALLSPVPEGEALLSPVPEGEALLSPVPEVEALISSVSELPGQPQQPLHLLLKGAC